MRPKGEDIDVALREWLRSEIKDGPARGYDLGKFLFAVSTGTFTLMSTAAQVSARASLPWIFYLSVGLFVVSIAVALNMVRPRFWRVDGSSDLFDEYGRQIRFYRAHIVVWLCVWSLAVGASLLSFKPNTL